MAAPVDDGEPRANGSDKDAGEAGDKSTREQVLEFCSEVSVMGVNYVADTSRTTWCRWLWALLVVAGLAFTLFQIVAQIIYYFSYPVNVIIRDEYSRELRFPLSLIHI